MCANVLILPAQLIDCIQIELYILILECVLQYTDIKYYKESVLKKEKNTFDRKQDFSNLKDILVCLNCFEQLIAK